METSIVVALNVPSPVVLRPPLLPAIPAADDVLEELPAPPHKVQPYTVISVQAVDPATDAALPSPSVWLRSLRARIAATMAPAAAAADRATSH